MTLILVDDRLDRVGCRNLDMKQSNGTSVAWLSSSARAPILVESTVSIGRSPNCDVVLNDPKVSRQHAVVHAASESEFWISDIGGCNGVYVNDHRIHASSKLRHGDHVRILDFCFRFLCPDAIELTSHDGDSSSPTLPCCKVENRWMLVADIMEGTQLAEKLNAEEYPRLLDKWFRSCRRVVEASHGSMNNYVGDGFLADWIDGPEVPGHIRRLVLVFAARMRTGDMPFRVALHYGEVTASGVGTMGEESLLGPQVNYVFRMERVAANSGRPILISQAAAERLAGLIGLEETPAMDVPSFGGGHVFFTVPEKQIKSKDEWLSAIRELVQLREFDTGFTPPSAIHHVNAWGL